MNRDRHDMEVTIFGLALKEREKWCVEMAVLMELVSTLTYSELSSLINLSKDNRSLLSLKPSAIKEAIKIRLLANKGLSDDAIGAMTDLFSSHPVEATDVILDADDFSMALENNLIAEIMTFGSSTPKYAVTTFGKRVLDYIQLGHL